ncbi:hypothetical protein [Klebsiella michiganensis]|nr:hypothetical protein [Klebsiella michiganensis]
MGYLLLSGKKKGRAVATFGKGIIVRNGWPFNIMVLTRTTENGLD